MQNDLPGPGTYDNHDQGVRDDRVYSKKGLGVGFVSKTKRDSAFKGSSSAPGPGNYECGGSFVDAVAQSNRANRSGTTATFALPTQRSVMVAQDPIPGPADYRLARQFDPNQPMASQPQTGASVFRSQTQRGQDAGGRKAAALPAPGQYNPVDPRTMAQQMPTAAFHSKVPIAGRDLVPRMTREQQLGVCSAAPRRAVPGPGEYELPPSSLEAPAHRRMPQFCESQHDRFGKLVPSAAPQMGGLSAPTPGPGAYIVDASAKAEPISSAVFMSGTARSGAGGRDVVPGPAYYTPASEARKSYHLNARSRWMPTC